MGYRRRSNTFQFEGDPLSENPESEINNYDRILFLIKNLQTKPQLKIMNSNYYDLYYTVIKNRDEKEVVVDDDENNDYLHDKFVMPNYDLGDKPHETKLR